MGCRREAMAPSAQASEIQSKLVAAIRTIAELEEKVEQCEKKSKELSADVERRGRQTFYLDRNLDTREREIQTLNRQMYNLEGKANPEDFEALREAQEKQFKDEAKQNASDLTKASSSSQEIISMFMDEFEKAAKEYAQNQVEKTTTQGILVDESSVFDLQKKHVRYLEQYRTDSIFRIFGLKAHCKVLEEKIESQQGINKLASSIGV